MSDRDDTPVQRHASLQETYRRLRVLYDDHTSAAGRLLSFPTATALDLFYLAIIQRSLFLVQGFIHLFERWNLVAAAPLVRLQIDNLTRTSYVARHPDAQTVAVQLWETEFRRMKDAKGKPLSDSRLVELAKAFHPWLLKAYQAGNGWVHLSPLHIWMPFDTFENAPAEDPYLGGGVELSIRHVRDDVPEALLRQVLEAMEVATFDLLAYVGRWEVRKAEEGR